MQKALILGIDPGSRKTGYAFIYRENSKFHAVDFGVIKPKTTMDFKDRITEIFSEINALIKLHHPVEMAMEDIFFSKNAMSALKLGHVRGAIMVAASLNQLPLAEYSPTHVKQAVSGSGRAQKHQVQQMVKMLFGLSEVPQEDAADALAVAVTHSFEVRL
ncbi:crossover junction endodeoxyribonuclease RuvC [bacterium]|nr:crossover junction endodeoxyribonuclease RuvC [bacterium]